MDHLDARELLAFPSGDNSSDTFINGIHWNLTTLKHWNYTYYSNGTFSNISRCYIIFEPYTPHLLPNGTFVNGTSCYSPIRPIGTRAKVGIIFAAFFASSIAITFVNLRKHGWLLLPKEKRFRAIGRRWQWYWMIAVATCGMISSLTGVDVDRYYLPELPIVLANFFWFLMLPFTMSVVWESVRHWGSWQERQMVDPNPFLLRQDDRRSKVELFLPLVFYFFAWMNFFMVVPRSWTPIEKQRSLDQAMKIAQPSATDIRFKLAAIFLFGGWLTAIFSLCHSIKHYKPPIRGVVSRPFDIIGYVPCKFLFTLPLSLVMIGYEAACAFDFSISPLNLNTNLAMLYGLGWTPISLIIITYEISGYIDPSEDAELIRQRRVRGAEIDRQLSITPKPRWWRRLHGDNKEISVHGQIMRNVEEINGGHIPSSNLDNIVEMGAMPMSTGREAKHPEVVHSTRSTTNTLSPDATLNGEARSGDGIGDCPNRSSPADGLAEQVRSRDGLDRGMNDRSTTSNSGVVLEVRPQIVRSMLDV